MEGGQAISRRLVGALLLVKPKPRRYCPSCVKNILWAFVLAFEGLRTACCRPREALAPNRDGEGAESGIKGEEKSF